ncbi:hypothetical protein V8C35DRAFT_11121 [Trichoderma chlorosporum]
MTYSYMSSPRLLVMPLEQCKCASNSRLHASGTSRRRRSKQPTAIHQLPSGPVLCLERLCSWSRGFRSTRYINDKHLCCVSRYLLSSFIQQSISRTSPANLLQTTLFNHLDYSCSYSLPYLSYSYKGSTSILFAHRRSNRRILKPVLIQNTASSRSLCTCSTLYIPHPTPLSFRNNQHVCLDHSTALHPLWLHRHRVGAQAQLWLL